MKFSCVILLGKLEKSPLVGFKNHPNNTNDSSYFFSNHLPGLVTAGWAQNYFVDYSTPLNQHNSRVGQ